MFFLKIVIQNYRNLELKKTLGRQIGQNKAFLFF